MSNVIPFKEPQKKQKLCAFCKKHKEPLVGEGTALICRDCLEHCNKLLENEND